MKKKIIFVTIILIVFMLLVNGYRTNYIISSPSGISGEIISKIDQEDVEAYITLIDEISHGIVTTELDDYNNEYYVTYESIEGTNSVIFNDVNSISNSTIEGEIPRNNSEVVITNDFCEQYYNNSCIGQPLELIDVNGNPVSFTITGTTNMSYGSNAIYLFIYQPKPSELDQEKLDAIYTDYEEKYVSRVSGDYIYVELNHKPEIPMCEENDFESGDCYSTVKYKYINFHFSILLPFILIGGFIFLIFRLKEK